MEINLEWKKELPLEKYNGTYELDLELISDEPGIYIFGRRHGGTFEALYVGQATNLHRRIKIQLNNHKLLNHVWSAKTGKRIVMLGEFNARQRQSPDNCLSIAEKALIRYFIAQGHDLVNRNGVNLRHHGISSTGIHRAKDFPNHIQIEVTK